MTLDSKEDIFYIFTSLNKQLFFQVEVYLLVVHDQECGYLGGIIFAWLFISSFDFSESLLFSLVVSLELIPLALVVSSQGDWDFLSDVADQGFVSVIQLISV